MLKLEYNQIWQRITTGASPYLTPLVERFDRLTPKDQKALLVLSGFLCLLIVYLMLWQPLAHWSENQYSQLQYEQETQSLLVDNTARIKSRNQKNLKRSSKDEATVIAALGRQSGLELSRVQPARQGVSVWIEEAPYQKVLNWLIQLNEQEQISVRQIQVDKSETLGMVKVFLRLSR